MTEIVSLKHWAEFTVATASLKSLLDYMGVKLIYEIGHTCHFLCAKSIYKNDRREESINLNNDKNNLEWELKGKPMLSQIWDHCQNNLMTFNTATIRQNGWDDVHFLYLNTIENRKKFLIARIEGTRIVREADVELTMKNYRLGYPT